MFSFSTFFPRDFVGGAFVGFDFEVTADFGFFFEFAGRFVFEILKFGNKRSFSNVTVAGVQVDIELTAARTKSAVDCREAMMIQSPRYSVIEN